jgi:hypothetical protein
VVAVGETMVLKRVDAGERGEVARVLAASAGSAVARARKRKLLNAAGTP